jgi:hypothetical protein
MTVMLIFTTERTSKLTFCNTVFCVEPNVVRPKCFV